MQKLQRVLVLEGVSWKEACDIFLLSLPAEEWRRDLLGFRDSLRCHGFPLASHRLSWTFIGYRD